LIAQAVFHLEDGYTDTHTQSQIPLITHPCIGYFWHR